MLHPTSSHSSYLPLFISFSLSLMRYFTPTSHTFVSLAISHFLSLSFFLSLPLSLLFLPILAHWLLFHFHAVTTIYICILTLFHTRVLLLILIVYHHKYRSVKTSTANTKCKFTHVIYKQNWMLINQSLCRKEKKTDTQWSERQK